MLLEKAFAESLDDRSLGDYSHWTSERIQQPVAARMYYREYRRTQTGQALNLSPQTLTGQAWRDAMAAQQTEKAQ